MPEVAPWDRSQARDLPPLVWRISGELWFSRLVRSRLGTARGGRRGSGRRRYCRTLSSLINTSPLRPSPSACTGPRQGQTSYCSRAMSTHLQAGLRRNAFSCRMHNGFSCEPPVHSTDGEGGRLAGQAFPEVPGTSAPLFQVGCWFADKR